MRARRSRFTRIYHRITRRAPNRRGQWQQIQQLRPHGSVGHPAASVKAYVPDPRPGRGAFAEPADAPPELDQLELLPEPEPEEPEKSAGTGNGSIAALTAALFLLACAYAAFSGYMHTYDDGLAFLGILGSVGSLMAAGVGICLAASGLRKQVSSRFLGLCSLTLAGLYAMLLFVAAGAH